MRRTSILVPILLSLYVGAAGSGAADLERINRSPFVQGGTLAGDSEVEEQALSADGRFLLFATAATAVVPGVLDLNGRADLFVKDLQLGSLELITRAAGMPGLTANGVSGHQQLSADGSVVVFESSATDLLASPQTAGTVYWHDRASGETRLACHVHGQPGVRLPCGPFDLRVSADGRYVAFDSSENASFFVPGATDANGGSDHFIWDSLLDTYQLVTHVPGNPLQAGAAAGAAESPQLSADGRFLAYSSRSADLAAGDSLGHADIFLYDRQNQTNVLVSAASGTGGPANGDSLDTCDMSPDGRYLIFASAASNLDPTRPDGNSRGDVYLFDRVGGALELISHVPAPGGGSGNEGSLCGGLSHDGRYVYFLSRANNLVTGVTDGGSSLDIFLHDRQSHATELLTRAWFSPALALGNASTEMGKVSADGRFLLFSHLSASLVDASFYGNGPFAYRYDRDLNQVELALAGAGLPLTTHSGWVEALSDDGATAIFAAESAAWLTGAPGPERDAPPLVQRVQGQSPPALVTPAAYSGVGTPAYPIGLEEAAVSGDGSKVVFPDGSRELCGVTANSLCLHARPAGTYTNINHRHDDPEIGVASRMSPLGLSGPDGRYVLVQSQSPLHTPVDTNETWDLFLYDSQTRAYELISRRSGTTGTAANSDTDNYAIGPMLTPDAGRIVFKSRATDLLAGVTDGNTLPDIYLRDRASGSVQLVSRRAGQPLTAGNGESDYPQIAAQGGYVLFASRSTDLVTGFTDLNGSFPTDLFLFEVATGNVTLVSRDAISPTVGSNGFGVYYGWISANGRFVAFPSSATNLIAGGSDANSGSDVFLFDRATGANRLVTHAAGQALVTANGDSSVLDMSSDGRFLLINTSATNLLPTPLPSTDRELYLWDSQDDSFRLVSHRRGAPNQPVSAISGRLSADASLVVFSSESPDVIPGIADTNGKSDLFAWRRASGQVELLTPRFGDSGATGQGDCQFVETRGLLDQGRGVLFRCGASDLAAHDSSFGSDLYLAHLTPPLFADGFESGGTGAWSFTMP